MESRNKKEHFKNITRMICKNHWLNINNLLCYIVCNDCVPRVSRWIDCQATHQFQLPYRALSPDHEP